MLADSHVESNVFSHGTCQSLNVAQVLLAPVYVISHKNAYLARETEECYDLSAHHIAGG